MALGGFVTGAPSGLFLRRGLGLAAAARFGVDDGGMPKLAAFLCQISGASGRERGGKGGKGEGGGEGNDDFEIEFGDRFPFAGQVGAEIDQSLMLQNANVAAYVLGARSEAEGWVWRKFEKALAR